MKNGDPWLEDSPDCAPVQKAGSPVNKGYSPNGQCRNPEFWAENTNGYLAQRMMEDGYADGFDQNYGKLPNHDVIMNTKPGSIIPGGVVASMISKRF